MLILRFFLIVFSIFIYTFTYAQQIPACRVITSENVEYPLSDITNATLRIAVFVINRSDGTGGLSAPDVMYAINKLKYDHLVHNH